MKTICLSLLCAALILAGLGLVSGAASAAQPEDERAGVSAAGRQAVLYGEIITIRRDKLTIRAGGDKIRVDASELSGAGSLRDFYEKGMFVTVEGTLTRGDEIAARTITRSSPYLTPPMTAVPPYIAQDAIISPEALQ